MTGHDYEIGYGASALDLNQLYHILNDDWVVSGCTPSDGTNSMEVDIASGVVAIDGDIISVSSQTVTLSASNSDPRKDIIYIDTTGSAVDVTGTAAPAEPSGDTQFQTYHPTPPPFDSTNGVVVAEIWVGGGVSDIGSSDIRDRTDNRNQVEQIDYSPGHTQWDSGISDNTEVIRYPGVTGEKYTIREISFMQKGGGTSSSASLDVYDPTAASQLVTVNLGSYDTNAVTQANSGNPIIVRVTNNTGSTVEASPRIDGWRQ